MSEINNSDDKITNYLVEFRQKQSSMLKIRLNAFTKSILAKYGSFDKIQKGELLPIESKSDVNVIKKMIELQNFISIPIFNDKGMTHIYTIGLWYYWGIPELVLNFKEPVENNIEFSNIMINLIYSALFMKNKNDIMTNDLDIINRNDYTDTSIELDDFNINFKLKKVSDDHYTDINTNYMLWFYMYYMDADKDDNDEFKMYPIYSINMDKQELAHITTTIIDFMENSTHEDL